MVEEVSELEVELEVDEEVEEEVVVEEEEEVELVVEEEEMDWADSSIVTPSLHSRTIQ